MLCCLDSILNPRTIETTLASLQSLWIPHSCTFSSSPHNTHFLLFLLKSHLYRCLPCDHSMISSSPQRANAHNKMTILITIQSKSICVEFTKLSAFCATETVNPYFPNYSSSCFTLSEVRREVKIKSSCSTLHLASGTPHHTWRWQPGLYSLGVSPPGSSSLTQLFHCHTPKMLRCHRLWGTALVCAEEEDRKGTEWDSVRQPL